MGEFADSPVFRLSSAVVLIMRVAFYDSLLGVMVLLGKLMEVSWEAERSPSM